MNEKLNEIVKKVYADSIDLKKIILESNLNDQIINTGLLLIQCLQRGGKIFFAGNGGSFADAQHLATEFISKFLIDRTSLPAIALGTNGSCLSAIANDHGFNNVFCRELTALATNKDVFIPISTSGKSQNLLEAIKEANKIGLKTIALTNISGGEFNKLCECIKVPSNNIPRIQECHIMIGHILCQIVEEGIFNSHK